MGREDTSSLIFGRGHYQYQGCAPGPPAMPQPWRQMDAYGNFQDSVHVCQQCENMSTELRWHIYCRSSASHWKAFQVVHGYGLDPYSYQNT